MFVGYHSVISGQLHATECEDTHFSPHISWSNNSYECQHQKSICSEEGQIVMDNGSTTKDVQCGCDYRKGYAFILQPKNECMCSPSVEDCSCYLVDCQHNRSILSQGKSLFISRYVYTLLTKIAMSREIIKNNTFKNFMSPKRFLELPSSGTQKQIFES